jgi:exodeoxyribonuclease III
VTNLRIVSWNVDGLERVMRLPGGLEAIVAGWGGADVVCLQEIRVRPTDLVVVADAERAMGEGYVPQLSLHRDRYNGRFRGGRAYGVATYAARHLAPRALAPLAWDTEGRVARMALDAAGVVLTNVYAVNGTFRPHFDPQTGAVVGTRHDWKRAFVDQLGEALASDGDRLVAIGDWNVTPAAIDTHPRLRTEGPHASARRRLARDFIDALDLVDVFRAMHPEARAYTWFDRRAERRGELDAARVDYALVARALVPRVVRCEVWSESERRAGSDHAPLLVELALP